MARVTLNPLLRSLVEGKRNEKEVRELITPGPAADEPRAWVPLTKARVLSLGEQLERGPKNMQRVYQMHRQGLQPAPGLSRDQVAELREVSASKQPAVADRVKQELELKLMPLTGKERTRLQPMIDAIGTPDFYPQAAKLDPRHAKQWVEMAGVQADFAKAEPGYDATARAYSESMRLTLQGGAVMQFASDPNQARNRYDDFIAGHITAFRENGGSLVNDRIGIRDSDRVLHNTPLEMARNTRKLLKGVENPNDVNMRTAAEMVRRARGEAIDSR